MNKNTEQKTNRNIIYYENMKLHFIKMSNSNKETENDNILW